MLNPNPCVIIYLRCQGGVEMTTKTKSSNEPKITALKFGVLIIVDKDEPGFYSYAPSLKGLHMGGETEEEARKNAIEAAELYLKSLLKHGDPLPIDILEPVNEEKNTITKKHISSRIEEIRVKI
jgi:predicted RNase H-like HicB family nuclease